MKKILITLTAVITACGAASAQQYRPAASAEIYRELQQLNVLGTVMYVAAHPDDENTRLLSYLVHHDHVRTIYLSLTRGDGGQNILGNEQGSTLGLIRNYELMEARKIDGAEQLFTNVIDFGFTKSPEETFRFWNKKDLTELVYEAYQQYHPDVIICRFPTTGEGGHGQHTTSAIVAGEAFKETRQKKDAWQPTRLLFNAFRFGSANTTSEDQFKIAINQFDPLLGEGFGEMAGRSRSVHKSQGAGTPQSVGIATEYFKPLDGTAPKQSLYDDIDLSWNRVNHPEIGAQVTAAINAFDFKNPAAILPQLIAIRKAIRSSVTDQFWKKQKLKELDAIILSCAGVMAELVTDQPEATPGSSVSFSLNMIARADKQPVELVSVNWSVSNTAEEVRATALYPDSLYKFPAQLQIPAGEASTEPYWLRDLADVSHYNYQKAYEGLPEAKNLLSAVADLRIAGELIQVTVPLSYKKLDPVRGDVVQRLRIVPPVSVKPYHTLMVFEKGAPQKVWVKLNAFKDLKNITVKAMLGEESIAQTTISSLAAGRDTLIAFTVPTDKIDGTDNNSFLLLAAEVDGQTYTRSRELIQYPHIPELQFFTGAYVKAIRKNWDVKAKKIGYIDGAGDFVQNILEQCGLETEKVPAGAINSPAYLAGYDAIVVGVRAFNTQPEMASWMPALMQYVSNGGNLVVQYNTAQGLLSDKLGPYPFSLSRDRVTQEDAAVTITDAGAPVLNYPNKIVQKDFSGWVQERGIYFPANWDEHYKTMLAMHDEGEKDLNSAILYTPYGKGNYFYTSLVFFRQLPAGNEGAIRLMMNMISTGK